MKVKLLLGALVLPAMFAACTNDVMEQVQSTTPDNSVLSGRAKGMVTLEATKSNVEGADTRVEGIQDGNGINWKWTGAEDKIGGVVVDYAPNNQIVNLKNYPYYVITNYPFAPTNISTDGTGADFETPTAVVDGAYMFYSQYDGQDTDRRTISHEMTRLQYVDAGWEAGIKQVGSGEYTNSKGEKVKGQNFFVSPIVDLAIADGADMQRPLALTSAHAMLHISFGSDLEDKYYASGLKINKVVIRALGARDNFKLKQTLDPAKIANLQKTVREANSGLAINADNNSIDGMANGAGDAINAVIAEITNKAKTVSEISVYDNTCVSKDLVYQLNEPFVFDDKGR